MKKTPLFSVVLPTYGRAHTLPRAIESVLAQTCQDFELLVVVDASPDGTDAVLARYAALPNVRIIASDRRNCSAARNLGVAASTSPYVAFQDSDDEWLPTHLETAMARLANTGPQVGVYYCDMIRECRDGTSHQFPSPEISPGRLINEATLDYQVYGLGIQATVIKRECLQQVGGFDEAMPRFVDLELFLRLAARFEFVHHREALVRYCECEGISTNAAALVTARRRLLEKYHDRLRQHPLHFAMQQVLLGQAFNDNGEKLKSAQAALRAWRVAPSHSPVRRQASRMLRHRLVFR